MHAQFCTEEIPKADTLLNATWFIVALLSFAVSERWTFVPLLAARSMASITWLVRLQETRL
jgi:hypothetical protein